MWLAKPETKRKLMHSLPLRRVLAYRRVSSTPGDEPLREPLRSFGRPGDPVTFLVRFNQPG